MRYQRPGIEMCFRVIMIAMPPRVRYQLVYLLSITRVAQWEAGLAVAATVTVFAKATLRVHGVGRGQARHALSRRATRRSHA